MEPTIYKRPHIYKSSVYKRYSIYNGLGVYKLPYGSPQGWTNENVPAGVQITHDFGDGLGPVPAVPVDACGVRNDVTGVITYPVNIYSQYFLIYLLVLLIFHIKLFLHLLTLYHLLFL